MSRTRKFCLIIFYVFLCFYLPLFTKEEVITIKKGDTLYNISRRYKISVDILMSYNGINDVTKISIGTKIRVPEIYKIKKGDTLYSIANKYNTSVDEISKINQFSKNQKLKIGMLIILPKNSVYSNWEDQDMGKDLLWPHSGLREKLTGKLEGIVIKGIEGDLFISIASGKVIWAGPYRGYGHMVFVKSDTGYVYVYAGGKELTVALGEEVGVATPLGRLGKNSHDGVAKVFFCVYKDRRPVNPYLAPRS